MATNYNHGFRSVYRLTAHVVLVTKYRRKAISEEILARLNEIFASTLAKWESSLLDKPYFWTGAYLVASCGGVTVEQLKKICRESKFPESGNATALVSFWSQFISR